MQKSQLHTNAKILAYLRTDNFALNEVKSFFMNNKSLIVVSFPLVMPKSSAVLVPKLAQGKVLQYTGVHSNFPIIYGCASQKPLKVICAQADLRSSTRWVKIFPL